ncbi:glycosyltransferase family 2 protein [Synechococcus sp. MIT S9452]|uniref:glycosyltransferase family 2 protein n=1 Tax=Synechococcus sp. MIT S9452 TaxID=3082546 RepID=UPI0039A6B57D
MKPTFSIIIPTFNCLHLLRRAVNSVYSLSCPSHLYELIVIDGGSCDGTIDYLISNSESISYWVSEPDSGLYEAWNKGLSVAVGDWILFLGSDDSLHHDALTQYCTFISNHPEYDYISAQVTLISPNGSQRIVGKPWVWKYFRHFMRTAHVASVHRRELFTRFGLFSMSYTACADYEFFLRIGPRLRAGFMPSVVASMATGGVSQSSLLPLLESRRMKIQLGVISPFRANIDFLYSATIWLLRRIRLNISL